MIRDERGSGTVLALAAVGVLLSVLWGAAVLGGVLLARHRAEAAADLGALAGAEAVQEQGPPWGCRRALAVARSNGATGRCRVVGEEVVLEASVPLPRPARAAGLAARAVARAGPAPGAGRGETTTPSHHGG